MIKYKITKVKDEDIPTIYSNVEKFNDLINDDLIPVSEDVKKKMKNELLKLGVRVDNEGPTMMGRWHMHFTSIKVGITNSEYQQFRTKLDKLDDEWYAKGIPFTYSYGITKDGQINGVVDIMKMYVKDSSDNSDFNTLKDSLKECSSENERKKICRDIEAYYGANLLTDSEHADLIEFADNIKDSIHDKPTYEILYVDRHSDKSMTGYVEASSREEAIRKAKAKYNPWRIVEVYDPITNDDKAEDSSIGRKIANVVRSIN